LIALDDPVLGADLRPLLGRPLASGERDQARAIVAGSGAIPQAVELARRYAADAVSALDGLPEALVEGLSSLAQSLVEDLPTASALDIVG
ncbi:MAG: hypothetical protein JO368_07525, partial [Acidimicrobiales bacterium]|nr:hypothetical protein [Acidimicrobiales bacterium]